MIMNIKDIGTLIQRRRKALRIDQRNLSDISRVSVHTLSNIEAGTGNPTVETLNQILDVLGLELSIQVKE